jgi:D-lactate dehydrogenase (cytochrome)
MRRRSVEGTGTGEHRVGYGDMDFWIEEPGVAVGIMRAIKRALDPHNLLNPGKLIRV